MRPLVVLGVVLTLVGALCHAAVAQSVRIERLVDAPIIRPEMDGSMGSNIAGPSLIRVPEWLPNPLGRYYLYFAEPPRHLHPSGVRGRTDRALDHV